MSPQKAAPGTSLHDGFPVTPSREAMVAGLTPPQFQVLCIANRFRDELPTQRQLARELYVSFPNVTVLLNRMERKGLIQRNGNPADRREKYVRVSTRGKKLLQRIWRVHQQQMDRVMKGLNVAERKEMAGLLNKMTAAHR